MFKLKQNNDNTIVLTISEKYEGELEPPTYICKLINNLNKEEKEFTLYNVSNNQERYDLFKVSLVSAFDFEDLNNAFVYLPTNGFYSYYIYEQSDEDTILESGKCYVYTGNSIETDENNIFYKNSENTITYE